MTTIPELAEDLLRTLDQLGSVDDVLARARTIAEVREALASVNSSLARILQFSDEALELGVISRPIKVPGGVAVATITRRMLEGFTGDGVASVEPTQASLLRNRVLDFESEARGAAVSSWREYCSSHPPLEITAEFLSMFRTINPAVVDALGDKLLTCRMNSEVPVPTRAVMISYRTAVAAIPELLKELVGDDPAVYEFVVAAGAEGAPLGSMTPRVRAWMDSSVPGDRTMTEFFRIVLRQSH